MTKGNKRFDRMCANPQDWKIEDVEKTCQAEGITCSPPKRGDHYKVSHPSQIEILTIPAKRPIKPVYIRKLIAFIEKVRENNDG